MGAASAVTPEEYFVVFLPFLRLECEKGYKVGDVEFLPLRDTRGNLPGALSGVKDPLLKILSGYLGRDGEPLNNCVVATVGDHGWDLKEEDFETVRAAAAVLFLASWACNEYFPKFLGKYTNSSHFRLVGQNYTGNMPDAITVSSRRRDGKKIHAGYEHGEWTFAMPTQCSVDKTVAIDDAFLLALETARTGGSKVIERLDTAMTFVELANTDDEFMTMHNEAILMGSAFEQIFEGGGAYGTATKFGDAFQEFGNVTVTDARKVRPGIQLKPKHEETQLGWYVHKKWVEELYDVRSKVAHRGTTASREWGWSIHEHLVMAAHVFPLAVKLLLVQEGYYTLTDADIIWGRSVDQVVATVDPPWENSWDNIREGCSRERQQQKDLAVLQDKYPDFFR